MQGLALRLGVVIGACALVACGGSGSESELGSSGGSSSGGSGGASSGGSGGTINLGGSGGSAATGTGGGAAADNCGQVLAGTIRDFDDTHPDFEYKIQDDRDIVTNMLGADGKPVYNGNPTTPTTNGQMAFDQWYRDAPGVNMPIPLSITLSDGGNGNYVYDNGDFFPIDNQGLGNQTRNHNFHFTYEINTQFEYKGGEVFTFRGDDDLFTYINGVLAINLGGVHGAQTDTIDLDARATELGITVGNTYSLDFFFAERHTSQSNFRIETTIGCFTPGVPR